MVIGYSETQCCHKEWGERKPSALCMLHVMLCKLHGTPSIYYQWIHEEAVEQGKACRPERAGVKVNPIALSCMDGTVRHVYTLWQCYAPCCDLEATEWRKERYVRPKGLLLK